MAAVAGDAGDTIAIAIEGQSDIGVFSGDRLLELGDVGFDRGVGGVIGEAAVKLTE